MKKVFGGLIVLSLIALFAVPVFASHPGGEHPTGKDLPEGPQTGTALLNLIDIITDWVFAVFTAIAVIYVVLAGFQFVTGGGEPAQVSGARQKLIFAVIGIGIALIAAGIDNVMRNIIGTGG